jgi:hypothetical protein
MNLRVLCAAALLVPCVALGEDAPTDLASSFTSTDQVVKEYQEQGLTLQPQAIADLKWFEKTHNEMKDTYKKLKGYEDAYGVAKNGPRQNQLRLEKEKLLALIRKSPTYQPSNAFLQNLNNYKSSAEFKKGNAWFSAIRNNLPIYEKEVGHLVTQGGETQSGGGATDPSGPGTPGSVAGNLEVYVIKTSGDFEFYVNNQKVTSAKQGFPLQGVGKFTVRAVGMGDKRKQSRNFVEPANTTRLAATDCQLHYKTDTQSFKGDTDWRVADGKVTWSGSTAGPHHKLFVGNSDTCKGVEGDLATFTFDGVFSFTSTVNESTHWKGTSSRPGGIKELEQTDKASGSIELSVSPKQ